jgi:phospholipid/cholesterol/gamma-HCH transport system substrate-binding protein
MAKFSGKAFKIVIGVVVVVIVAGVAWFAFLRPSPTRTVTADFPEAVGIYPGTPVKILGVNVGKVDSATPMGSYVKVTISYSASYKVPAKASAVEVANSLVSDRYIQLTPVYTGGAVMADHANIPMSRTGSPSELDDIYAALDKLAVALGPNGANKGGKQNGPLSTLLKVSAANLKGNGTALGNSITKLAAAARTLADGRENLFGTVRNLAQFSQTLASSDTQVRLFNTQLAQVTSDLAGERGDLGLALRDLGTALDEVKGFIQKNATKFHTSVKQLEGVTDILVQEKSSLEETLAVAPVALANIVHAYQPNIGAIATRGNLASLTDIQPPTVCALLYNAIGNNKVGNILGPVTKAVIGVCGKVLGKDPSKAIQQILGLTKKQLEALRKKLLGGLGGGGGGLPGGIGGIVGGPGETSQQSGGGGLVGAIPGASGGGS